MTFPLIWNMYLVVIVSIRTFEMTLLKFYWHVYLLLCKSFASIILGNYDTFQGPSPARYTAVLSYTISRSTLLDNKKIESLQIYVFLSVQNPIHLNKNLIESSNFLLYYFATFFEDMIFCVQQFCFVFLPLPSHFSIFLCCVPSYVSNSSSFKKIIGFLGDAYVFLFYRLIIKKVFVKKILEFFFWPFFSLIDF